METPHAIADDLRYAAAVHRKTMAIRTRRLDQRADLDVDGARHRFRHIHYGV